MMWVIVVVSMLAPAAMAQQQPSQPSQPPRKTLKEVLLPDTVRYFRIILDVSGGLSGALRPIDQRIPVNEIHRKGGLDGTLSIRATANDLISVGVQTGFITLSQSTFRDSITRVGTRVTAVYPAMNTALYAIPVLVQADIQKWNFHLSAGFGMYYLLSSTQLTSEALPQYRDDAPTINGGWEMGYSVGLGYLFYLSPNLTLGPQAEWHYIPDEPKSIFLAQLKCSYTIRF